ncbi:hypothetical protein, partial [Sinosporangium album]|uniref:hypothetical protein n=1 Tax=Sinosporangium album TaxID=504805 RepID=UPI001C40ABF5
TPPAFVLSQDQTLQTMSVKQNPAEHPKKGCQPKEPSPTIGGWTEVMHHALAFSTLLSSQETNASTIRPDPQARSSGAYPFRSVVLLFFPFSAPASNQLVSGLFQLSGENRKEFQPALSPEQPF